MGEEPPSGNTTNKVIIIIIIIIIITVTVIIIIIIIIIVRGRLTQFTRQIPFLNQKWNWGDESWLNFKKPICF